MSVSPGRQILHRRHTHRTQTTLLCPPLGQLGNSRWRMSPCRQSSRCLGCSKMPQHTPRTRSAAARPRAKRLIEVSQISDRCSTDVPRRASGAGAATLSPARATATEVYPRRTMTSNSAPFRRYIERNMYKEVDDPAQTKAQRYSSRLRSLK
jgi:hypothetical protein